MRSANSDSERRYMPLRFFKLDVELPTALWW